MDSRQDTAQGDCRSGKDCKYCIVICQQYDSNEEKQTVLHHSGLCNDSDRYDVVWLQFQCLHLIERHRHWRCEWYLCIDILCYESSYPRFSILFCNQCSSVAGCAENIRTQIPDKNDLRRICPLGIIVVL